MNDRITITLTDPELTAPITVTVPQHHAARRDVRDAFTKRLWQEWELARSLRTQQNQTTAQP